MSKKQISYNIPEGWVTVSLSEILSLEYGKSLTGENRREGKYPVLGSNGTVGYHDEFLVPGPVIVIGRKGSVGTVHYINEECWPIDTTYYVTPTASINFKFIYYLLKQLNLQNLDKSTTIPGLNRDNIYEQNVLLPPLNEQNRIVEKIEEIFSELEKNSELLQITIEQLAIYKKSVLRNAFEGKATQQWRDKIEPKKNRNTLLKNIRQYWSRSYEKKISEYNQGLTKKRPLKHEEIILSRDLLGPKVNTIPKGWVWVKLLDIVENDSIKIHPNQNPNLKFVGMDCIDPNSLQPSKFYKFSEFKSAGNLFKKDHVIYGRMRPYLNKVWKAEFEGACSGEFIVLKTFDNLHPDYLKYNLHSSRFVTFASRKASGDRPRISFEEMGEFYFPLCSIEEQTIIVENLDKQLSYIDNLETVIKSTLLQAEASKRTLLNKAFQGKLVEQHAGDEPASILLNKIKEERLVSLEIEKQRKLEKKTVTQKTYIMAEEQKQIIDLIKDNEKPIPAHTLWLKSPYKDDIEGFYAELKKLIESGQIMELPRVGKEARLKLNKSR